MKTEFRNRAFLPIVMPLAVLGVIAAVVGVMATILLHVDRQGAVAIALFAAAGVLLSVTLATMHDRLDLRHRGGVALAVGTPVVVGALVATGILGGIADEDRNINVLPHGPQFVFAGIEEGVPVVGANSAVGFCLPDQCDTDDITHEWELTYDADGEIAYAFDNRDSSAPHNLFMYDLPDVDLGTIDSALGSTTLGQYELISPAEPPTFVGPEQQTYRWTLAADTELPDHAYFVCTVHAGTMWGVVTLVAE